MTVVVFGCRILICIDVFDLFLCLFLSFIFESKDISNTFLVFDHIFQHLEVR